MSNVIKEMQTISLKQMDCINKTAFKIAVQSKQEKEICCGRYNHLIKD